MTQKSIAAPSALTEDDDYCNLFVQIYLRRQIAAAFNDYWNNMAMSSVMSGSERCIMAPANNLRLRYCDTGMNIQYGSHNLIINFGENRILVAESGEKSQV